jgi:hypothetical protein
VVWDEAQAIDDVRLVVGESGSAAETVSNVAEEPALWRAAHKNGCGAKTYI